jgi:hypothetical protein
MNSGFLAAVAIMAISIFAFGANESKFFIDEEGRES